MCVGEGCGQHVSPATTAPVSFGCGQVILFTLLLIQCSRESAFVSGGFSGKVSCKRTAWDCAPGQVNIEKESVHRDKGWA